ncbi:MAG TPA: tetratricopeptide repeat protein [Bacteroidales bacterium]|nr:tetratricopeptide repeat protein [Bacteroidales bacterium]
MSKKKKEDAPELVEGVENALSRTEQYIEENQKSLTIIVAAIIIIVGGYLGYKRFIVTPKEAEAQSQMFMAEKYFEMDSLNLALNGDGNYLGFLDIIDDYGITSAANLANYYAGISYLHLGQYQQAIDYLKDFDANDEMIGPIAYGAIGDAYVELGDLEQGVTFYEKAANKGGNEFVTPIYLMKAGEVYENLEKYQKALEAYQRIEKDYKQTSEGRQIEKYITRVKLHID